MWLAQNGSVVLLDEVEKAHPEVLDLFLPCFDEGYLTDARGQRHECKQCAARAFFCFSDASLCLLLSASCFLFPALSLDGALLAIPREYHRILLTLIAAKSPNCRP